MKIKGDGSFADDWYYSGMPKKFSKVGVPVCSNCSHPHAVHHGNGDCLDIHPKRKDKYYGDFCPCTEYQ